MARKKGGAGIPPWMATFADLMALMMCFFVLLYSFSYVDEVKYKMVVASMAKGFGQTPTATRSQTSSSIGPPSLVPNSMKQSTRARPMNRREAAQDTKTLRRKIQEQLHDEIAKGNLSVETAGNNVVIRFPEEIAFPPGSDIISEEILPILRRVTEALSKEPGTIQVSGHTDDRPINTGKFKSNWELSTNRAVSIIHLIEDLGTVDSSKLTAVGYADTRPIFPNDTPEGRSRNRRVEITIIREGGAGNPAQSIAPPML